MTITWKNLEHKWRKQLLSSAHGKVLEISAGMGENFEHYPLNVDVTATDTSVRLMEVAKAEAVKHGVSAKLKVSPVEDLDFEVHSFDTIVSTFSITEFENPAWVLRRLSTWCKPEGTILLLVQGLSNYRPVRMFQKLWDRPYHKKSGSHINRDIKAIIGESRLGIKKMERKMAGVIYMIWASPVTEQKEEIARIKL